VPLSVLGRLISAAALLALLVSLSVAELVVVHEWRQIEIPAHDRDPSAARLNATTEFPLAAFVVV
jgi:hypothetical protein